MKLLLLLSAAMLAVTPAVAASSEELYMRYFAGADGGQPCYARHYDEVHLRAHRKQTVRRIEVDFDKDFGEGGVPKNTATSFEAGIRFVLKRSTEWYGDALYCKTLSDHFDCYLDADGGTIRLWPHGDGLRFEVTGGGGGTDQITVEGGKDFGQFGAPASDDRVFVLSRTNRYLCRSAR